ncbi:MAG: hypothetical protein II747_04665 [Clostridia bacterium]|nr:hypothetical protein [Clostridia bacterium]
MKKIITTLVALAMLLTLAAVPASAARTPRFYIEGPSSAKVGDKIDVSVKVEGDYEAHTMNLRIFFDNTSLHFENRVYGEAYNKAIAQNGFGTCDVTKDGNAVSLGLMMLTEPTSVEGELVKITFEVRSTASPNIEISVQVVELGYMPVGQSHATDIESETTPLKISISGGTGTGTTPVPIKTQKPANTEQAGKTTQAPGGTEGTGNNHGSTLGTNAPSKTEQAPDVSSAPDSTQTVDNTESVVDNTAEADNTPTSDGTQVPESTPDANATQGNDAENTPAPGEKTNTANNTGLYIAIAAVAAVVAAVSAVIVKKKK